MENNLLSLIPFATQSSSDAVRKAIIDIGYQVDIFRSDKWLMSSEKVTTNLSILLLDSVDLPSEALREILVRENRVPTFAIVPNLNIPGNTQIVDLCDDFSIWPCRQHELMCRLERLSNQEEQFNSNRNNIVILEEFIGLNLIGRSEKFLHALHLIKRIARCDAPVIIEGETGTGKEVAARAIHYLSARRDHPFVPINCGAIPDNLIENELFGHEKGAFTDARDHQPGLIAQAEGGTLFLDEIDTLSEKAQVTLLRFLQDQQYKPLGAKRSFQANVRIVTATNANITRLVEQGHFRQDLFFRLNIMTVNLPPLRERFGDIRMLAEHFMQKYRDYYNGPDKHLHRNTVHWLVNYSWPGNVRELENTIHRIFLLADGPTIYMKHNVENKDERRKKSTDRRKNIMSDMNFNEAKALTISEFEENYLRRVMSETRGNVSLAAKLIGKERRALGKLLKKHQIEKSE